MGLQIGLPFHHFTKKIPPHKKTVEHTFFKTLEVLELKLSCAKVLRDKVCSNDFLLLLNIHSDLLNLFR